MTIARSDTDVRCGYRTELKAVQIRRVYIIIEPDSTPARGSLPIAASPPHATVLPPLSFQSILSRIATTWHKKTRESRRVSNGTSLTSHQGAHTRSAGRCRPPDATVTAWRADTGSSLSHPTSLARRPHAPQLASPQFVPLLPRAPLLPDAVVSVRLLAAVRVRVGGGGVVGDLGDLQRGGVTEGHGVRETLVAGDAVRGRLVDTVGTELAVGERQQNLGGNLRDARNFI